MMRNLLGIGLAGLLAVGVAGSAGAATISYVGNLSFGISTFPVASGTGIGTYLGPNHITSIPFTEGQFGPINVSLPVTSSPTTRSSSAHCSTSNSWGAMRVSSRNAWFDPVPICR